MACSDSVSLERVEIGHVAADERDPLDSSGVSDAAEPVGIVAEVERDDRDAVLGEERRTSTRRGSPARR